MKVSLKLKIIIIIIHNFLEIIIIIINLLKKVRKIVDISLLEVIMVIFLFTIISNMIDHL